MKIIIAFFALAFYLADAKVFQSRCELVRELRRQGFPEHKLRDWVCLVENGSRAQTDRVTTLNDEQGGSWSSYGLFQINEYECKKYMPDACNVHCSELLTDDISTASWCAKHVQSLRGFGAFAPWRQFCHARESLPDISSCWPENPRAFTYVADSNVFQYCHGSVCSSSTIIET